MIIRIQCVLFVVDQKWLIELLLLCSFTSGDWNMLLVAFQSDFFIMNRLKVSHVQKQKQSWMNRWQFNARLETSASLHLHSALKVLHLLFLIWKIKLVLTEYIIETLFISRVTRLFRKKATSRYWNLWVSRIKYMYWN